jgi:hypothetical protein
VRLLVWAEEIAAWREAKRLRLRGSLFGPARAEEEVTAVFN